MLSGCALNMGRWAPGLQCLVFGHVSFCLLILEHYLGPQMTSFGFCSSGVSTRINGITVTSMNLRDHDIVHVCEGVLASEGWRHPFYVFLRGGGLSLGDRVTSVGQ